MNNYRKTYRLCLAALLALLMLAGGCRHTPVPPADLTPEAWLAQDAEGCLRHYTRSFTRLSGEVGYDSVRRLYAGLMRRLPEHPVGDADSVAFYMGQVLAYYNNTLLLSPRDSVDAHRPYREAVRLPDSLLRSPHRLYGGTLRYELLTYGAQLHMMAHEGSTADSMARALLALPPLQDHARAARVYHVMAWTAGFYSPRLDIAIALEERAVAACRAGGRLVADGAVFSRMGYFYRFAGRYDEAVSYIQEAIDYYIDYGLRQAGTSATAPGAAGDRRGNDSLAVYPFPVERTPDGRITSETASLFTGIVRAYGDLASLYATLGLYDKALEANNLALHYSRQADGILLPSLCRLRSDYLSAAGQPKASLAWLDSAYAAHVRRKGEEGVLLRIRRTRIGQAVEAYPDSAVYYLGEARAHLEDSAAVSYKSLPGVYELYGTVLARCPGREREAVPYLEEAFRGYTVRHQPLGSEQVGGELLKIYARTGQYVKLGRLYPAYAALRDSLWRDDRQRAAIGANIRYETGRKEQENELLAAEVSLKRRTLAFAWVLSGLLAVMLAGAVLYARQRRRYHRRVSEAHLARIGSLLEARRRLTERNESLSAELLKVSQHCTSDDDLRTQICTPMFDADKEASFRRSFTALYPGYLPALHRIYPSLTRTDELIAMLLLLDLSNDEIALTLGVSKTSVHKARSRMRKRLGLHAEVKLMEFLRGL